MRRFLQSIRFQLIFILIAFAILNTYFISSVVIRNVRENILNNEFDRLSIISSQLQDKYEKMYFAEYITRNLASLPKEQRDVYFRIFLKPAFEEYFSTFTSSFPSLEFGYFLPVIDKSVQYKQLEKTYFKEKITVVVPVSDEYGGGYVFVDRPVEDVLKPVTDLTQEINRISLYILLGAILVALILTALYTTRIISLRRGLKILEKNLDFRFPNYSGEIGDIAVSVNTMAENLKKSVEEMQKTESLKNLGMFTVGVVHEVRNPLTSIKGFAEILSKKLQGKEEAKYVTPIMRETERLSQVVDELLKYGRPSEIKRTHFNTKDFFDHIIEIARSYAKGKQIEFVKDYEDFSVHADEQKLEELFLNILVNAVQAIEQTGTVKINCKKDKDQLNVEITDNGVGMTEDEQKNLFVPFYTTKASGTGLGLAIAYRIAREHGGEIIVNSKKEEGTTFLINIPVGEQNEG